MLALTPETAGPVLGLVLGATASATVLGMAAWWIVRKTARPAQTRLVADERGTAVFEFPFALLTLIIVVMLTWQLGLLASAYLVVDHAAFVAARSAAVVIGEDAGPGEGKNRLASADFTGRKGRVVKEATALALVPIAGETPMGSAGRTLARDAYAAMTAIDVPGKPRKSYTPGSVQKRVVYALESTRVKAKTGVRYFGGKHVTVEVEHDFALVIPFARRLLGTRKGKTYVSPIRASATVITEGFGPEQVPPGVRKDLIP